MRAHGAPLHPSGAAVPDGDLFPFHDYRDTTLTLGMDEHLVQPLRIPVNVVIGGAIPIGLPGLIGVGSAALAVNNNLVGHGYLLLQRESGYEYSPGRWYPRCPGRDDFRD